MTDEYAQNRKNERENKQAISLISKSNSNIWLKLETVELLRKCIGAETGLSLILLSTLYPKKASDFQQIVIPYNIALDIAEGARDAEDTKEEGLRFSGIVFCRDDSSGTEYLLLSSEGVNEPKIVVINALLLTDRSTSSSSFSCSGMEYLCRSEDYRGQVLLADAEILERMSIN